jgi:hypothetical protein
MMRSIPICFGREKHVQCIPGKIQALNEESAPAKASSNHDPELERKLGQLPLLQERD